MFFQTLSLWAALEIGFLSGGLYNYQARSVDWSDMGALSVTMEASLRYKAMYVGGQMDCYFTPLDLTHFSPFQMTYIFNAGLDFDTVQIGYEHSCFHPMQPYATIIGNEIKPKYEGGYNRWYVKFSTK